MMKGAGGITVGDVSPADARDMAAALGICLQMEPPADSPRNSASGQSPLSHKHEANPGDLHSPLGGSNSGGPDSLSIRAAPAARGSGGTSCGCATPIASYRGHPNTETPSNNETDFAVPPSGNRPPIVVIAGDGRSSAAEFIAAVSEAVRWAGCHVVDIGPASAACLTTAIDRLSADGGILVGNPGPGSHTTGLKFWAHSATPLSRGGLLDRLRKLCDTGIDRPTRAYGSLGRHQAEVDYLVRLAPEYHALRPLQFVLDSTCGAWGEYLRELTRSVACRILPCRRHGEGLGQQVVEDRAHFGLRVEDDGEICHLVDERGQAVPPERLFLLVARSVLSGSQASPSSPHAPCAADVVLEEDASPGLIEDVRSLGGRVVASGALRQAMACTIRRHGAILGGGPSGRFWYSVGGVPVPDALRTFTRLLVLLSRSDRTLSEVLDHEAPAR